MYRFCLFALLVTLISAQATTLWTDGLPGTFDDMVTLITDGSYSNVIDRLDDDTIDSTCFFPVDSMDLSSIATEDDVSYLIVDGAMDKAAIIALFGGNNLFGNHVFNSSRDGTWIRINGYGGAIDGSTEPAIFTVNGVLMQSAAMDASVEDNGYAHGVSGVPMWSADMAKTILEELATNAEFSTTLALLGASGIGSGDIPNNAAVTLFVPNNAAWDQLKTDIGDEYYDALTTMTENQDLLKGILTHHVGGGIFFYTPMSLSAGNTVIAPSVTFGTDTFGIAIQVPLTAGDPVKLSLAKGTEPETQVNGTIIDFDMHRANGIIHTIDTVLLADDFDVSWIQLPSNDTTTGDATTGDATTGDATTGDATTGDATTGDATTGDATTGDATTGDATTGDATTGDATTGDATTGDATTGDATTAAATTAAATTAAATTAAATTAAATTGAPPTTDSAATLVAGVLVLLALLL